MTQEFDKVDGIPFGGTITKVARNNITGRFRMHWFVENIIRFVQLVPCLPL